MQEFSGDGEKCACFDTRLSAFELLNVVMLPSTLTALSNLHKTHIDKQSGKAKNANILLDSHEKKK
jgi:hypothetical protein